MFVLEWFSIGERFESSHPDQPKSLGNTAFPGFFIVSELGYFPNISLVRVHRYPLELAGAGRGPRGYTRKAGGLKLVLSAPQKIKRAFTLFTEYTVTHIRHIARFSRFSHFTLCTTHACRAVSTGQLNAARYTACSTQGAAQPLKKTENRSGAVFPRAVWCYAFLASCRFWRCSAAATFISRVASA